MPDEHFQRIECIVRQTDARRGRQLFQEQFAERNRGSARGTREKRVVPEVEISGSADGISKRSQQLQVVREDRVEMLRNHGNRFDFLCFPVVLLDNKFGLRALVTDSRDRVLDLIDLEFVAARRTVRDQKVCRHHDAAARKTRRSNVQ